MSAMTAEAVRDQPVPQHRDPAPARAALLWWRLTAAATLLAAAALHALAATEHAGHWPTASRFFIGLQLAQTWLGLALLLNLRTRTAARMALVVSVATLALWALSRTVGLPIGPDAGVAEPVERLDLAVALLEILTIAAVPVLLGAWQRSHRAGALLRAPATVAAVLLGVVLLTAWGAAGARGAPDAPAGHPGIERTSHDRPLG